MTTKITTAAEVRDNADETRKSSSCGGIPVFGWGWPDEARLANFAEQDVQAEKDDRVKQADRMIVNDSEYATLYFVS